MSWITLLIIVLLLGTQFSLVYIPMALGFGTIHEYTNLVCMALGALLVVWVIFCKATLRFFIQV